MKSSEYWKKRSEQIAKRQYDKADQYEAEMGREYSRATQEIQRRIDVFYQRYAINNEISFAEARKMLSSRELKEFRMTLEEFTAKAKNNADGRWTQQLNSVYYRTRVSRLEALQVQIRQQVEMLAASRQDGAKRLFSDIYEDTYYRNLFEIQKGIGIGVSFAHIDPAGVEKVLGTEFAGSNWSKRIWGDRDKLAGELRTKLSQSFIRGDSVDRTVRDLTERMNVSLSRAEALVQTESAFFLGQATMDGYKASELVRKYEVLSTLDNKTTPICRSLDGEVFPISEAEVNVNYPPFHVRCRTTTVAAFDDEIDVGERIARDGDGNVYYVPGDMKFEDWKKKYVDQPKSDIIESTTQFTTQLSKTSGMTAEYLSVLASRVDAGTEPAKQVYLKYVKDGAVKDGKYADTAHYSPSNQWVKMDFAGDFTNARGPGATYFHEFGHYIDHAAAMAITGSKTQFVSHMPVGNVGDADFRKAILADVQTYITDYARKNKINLAQAQRAISQVLRTGDGGLHEAISDIYGGVTGGAVQGRYGHDPKYWRQMPHAIELETFAHMVEANFDATGQRLPLIKEYFPTAYGIFIKIMEAIR